MKTPLLFLLLPLVAHAAVYHVDPHGDDAADGSAEAPWATLQHAADRVQPGDTVLVREGTYAPFHIAARGAPDAWITFRSAPGQRPKVVFDGWWGIELRTTLDGTPPAYIEIAGFEVEGVRHPYDPVPGNGIGVRAVPNHHIRVLRNIVHGCGGGGIVMQRGDHWHIEGNIVHETSHGTIPPEGRFSYANSAISVYQAEDIEPGPGDRILIRGNTVYGNYNTRPMESAPDGKLTDGNGIIIDDNRHTQRTDGPPRPYTGRIRIDNNVVYGNGGRGIHVYLSDNVAILNNTVFANQRSDDIDDGEITVIQSADVLVRNNIAVALRDRKSAWAYEAERVTWDHNLFQPAPPALVQANGPGTLAGVDPRFTRASAIPAEADFRLRPGSLAIDGGSSEGAPPIDHEQRPRPSGSRVDLGAYEAP